jgi:ERF superfamily
MPSASAELFPVSEATPPNPAQTSLLPEGATAAPPAESAGTAPASPRSLVRKLSEVMGELDWIEKRGYNSFHNYYYALESDILDAIRSKLAVRGIFVQTLIQDSVDEKTERTSGAKNLPLVMTKVNTRHIFHDADTGETMEVNGKGVGEDSGDKGLYKAVTGAMKQAMAKNFMISSGNDPEREDESGAKGKTKGGKAPDGQPPAPAGPARQGKDAEEFTIRMQVTEVEIRTVGGGSKKYGFKLPQGTTPAYASTFDEKLYASLLREKETGMLVDLRVRRNKAYLDIVSFNGVPPAGVQ